MWHLQCPTSSSIKDIKERTNQNTMANIEKVIVKARYWWFVLYPESAREDWREWLQSIGLPFAVSPLHDKDVNPDGTEKKPHHHIIIAFNGPTTYQNVNKNICEVLGQPHPQYLFAVKGAYRYLTHADNPEKYQYDPKEIELRNGFDVAEFCEMTITDEDRLYQSIEDIIFSNDFTEFFEVVVHLKQEGYFEMLSFFRRHSVYFRELINSYRFYSRQRENS